MWPPVHNQSSWNQFDTELWNVLCDAVGAPHIALADNRQVCFKTTIYSEINKLTAK